MERHFAARVGDIGGANAGQFFQLIFDDDFTACAVHAADGESFLHSGAILSVTAHACHPSPPRRAWRVPRRSRVRWREDNLRRRPTGTTPLASGTLRP